MPEPMFSGVFCALVTPFRDGTLDEAAVLFLAERQVVHGASGLIVGGVIGEGWALSSNERSRALTLAIQAAEGKIPVLAAIGADATADALEQAAAAEAAGAAGLLVSAPVRPRLNQGELQRHFEAIAAFGPPILIEAGPSLAVSTLAALARMPGVAGVVDTSGDLSRASATRRACPDGFGLFTSDDATALAFLAHGGHGVASLTCNVAPKSVTNAAMWWSEEDAPRALAAQGRMIRLHQVLAAIGPAGAKFALSRMGGLCAPDVRAPLEPLIEDLQQALMLAMDGAAEPMHPY